MSKSNSTASRQEPLHLPADNSVSKGFKPSRKPIASQTCVSIGKSCDHDQSVEGVPASKMDRQQHASSDEPRTNSSTSLETIGYFSLNNDGDIIPLLFDAGRPSPVDLTDPLSHPFIFDCDGNIVPQPYRLTLPGRHPVEPVGAENPADPPLDPFVFDYDGYINTVPQNRNVRQ